jgi:hypothetical protein
VGALAGTGRIDEDRPAETEANRAYRAAASRRPTSTRPRASWNVLAEELVAFPPAGTSPVARPTGRALDAAPFDVAWRRPGAPVGTVARPAPLARPPARPGPAPLVRPAPAAHVFRSPRAAPRSRGLRRLLPGAAALAVLAGAWFGVGALSNSPRPAPAVIPGAVKIPGGYRYVARPGDTLWSIATKLQPGADPRVLVASLEQQLHGGELIAGDQLKLP